MTLSFYAIASAMMAALAVWTYFLMKRGGRIF